MKTISEIYLCKNAILCIVFLKLASMKNNFKCIALQSMHFLLLNNVNLIITLMSRMSNEMLH